MTLHAVGTRDLPALELELISVQVPADTALAGKRLPLSPGVVPCGREAWIEGGERRSLPAGWVGWKASRLTLETRATSKRRQCTNGKNGEGWGRRGTGRGSDGVLIRSAPVSEASATAGIGDTAHTSDRYGCWRDGSGPAAATRRGGRKSARDDEAGDAGTHAVLRPDQSH